MSITASDTEARCPFACWDGWGLRDSVREANAPVLANTPKLLNRAHGDLPACEARVCLLA